VSDDVGRLVFLIIFIATVPWMMRSVVTLVLTILWEDGVVLVGRQIVLWKAVLIEKVVETVALMLVVTLAVLLTILLIVMIFVMLIEYIVKPTVLALMLLGMLLGVAQLITQLVAKLSSMALTLWSMLLSTVILMLLMRVTIVNSLATVIPHFMIDITIKKVSIVLVLIIFDVIVVLVLFSRRQVKREFRRRLEYGAGEVVCRHEVIMLDSLGGLLNGGGCRPFLGVVEAGGAP
jgi:hypothetical protein